MGLIEKQIAQCWLTKTPIETVKSKKRTIKLMQIHCFGDIKLIVGIQK